MVNVVVAIAMYCLMHFDTASVRLTRMALLYGCKCTLTSGADLNVIRNPCPDHTYSTDTDNTAAALLVNNMRKRVR